MGEAKLSKVFHELAEAVPWYFNNRRCYTMRDQFEQLLAGDGEISEKVRNNKFLQKAKEFMLVGSEAGALGELTRRILEAAYPVQVGREMVVIYESTEPKIRIPKMPVLTAYEAGPGAHVPETTPSPEYLDLDVNDPDQAIRIRAEATWDITWLSMTNWPAVEAWTRGIGEAIGRKETEKIVALFNGIADADLAGGGPVALGAAPITFDDIIDLKAAIDSEDRTPRGTYRCFLHPTRLNDLLKDPDFVNSLVWGGQVNKDAPNVRGRFGTVANIEFYSSTHIPENTVYVINPERAAAMLIHKDITIEPWEKEPTISGIIGYEYAAARIIDSKAVAKGTVP